jgi:hypothetical protein
MYFRKIKLLVIGKEIEEPLGNGKRFTEVPKLSQKVLGL